MGKITITTFSQDKGDEWSCELFNAWHFTPSFGAGVKSNLESTCYKLAVVNNIL